MTNIHPGTIEQVYKCASINLSPNTVGQVALSCLINPPKPGDESFERDAAEKASELASLKRRAQLVTDAFNKMEGVTCNFTEGAMYAFPRVRACGRPAGRQAVQPPRYVLCVCGRRGGAAVPWAVHRLRVAALPLWRVAGH